ncbi:MAG: hypothetical protein MR412_03050 [Firmicutes bacterium]|nr:hypothetical protein [Bacillota bacterium]
MTAVLGSDNANFVSSPNSTFGTAYKATFASRPFSTEYTTSLKFGGTTISTTASDTTGYGAYIINVSGTNYYYRMYWTTGAKNSNPSSITSTGSLKTPSSSSTASNINVWLIEQVQLTVDLNKDSIYNNSFYSSLYEMGARVGHRISTTAVDGTATANANVLTNVTTGYTSTAHASIARTKVVQNIDGHSITLQDSGQFKQDFKNIIFVDKGGSYTYEQLNGTDVTIGGVSYNLGYLFNRNQSKVSKTISNTMTLSIAKVTQISNKTGVYIVNKGLQYNKDNSSLYTYVPYISFYSCSANAIDHTHSTKMNLSTTSSSTSSESMLKLADKNTSDILVGKTIYPSGSSIKIASITLKGSDQTTDGGYAGSANKVTYIIETVYGNYIEVTRGDNLDNAAYDNILISIEATGDTSLGDKDITFNNRPVIGTAQPLSKYGHKSSNAISTMQFTYAPYITLNFEGNTTAYSAQANALKLTTLNPIENISINALLDGDTSTKAPQNHSGYSWTYDLADTDTNKNLVVTVTITMRAGYKYNGVKIGTTTYTDSGTTLATIPPVKPTISGNTITFEVTLNKAQYLNTNSIKVQSQIEPQFEEIQTFGMGSPNSSSVKITGRGQITIGDKYGSNTSNSSNLTLNTMGTNNTVYTSTSTALKVYYYSILEVQFTPDTNFVRQLAKINGVSNTEYVAGNVAFYNASNINYKGTYTGSSFVIEGEFVSYVKLATASSNAQLVSRGLALPSNHGFSSHTLDKTSAYDKITSTVSPATGYEVKYYKLYVYKTSDFNTITKDSANYTVYEIYSDGISTRVVPKAYTFTAEALEQIFTAKLSADKNTIEFNFKAVDGKSNFFGSTSYMEIEPIMTETVKTAVVKTNTNNPVKWATNTLNARYIRVVAPTVPAFTVYTADGAVTSNGTSTHSKTVDLGELKDIVKIVVNNTSSAYIKGLYVSQDGTTWYTITDDFVENIDKSTVTYTFVADYHLNYIGTANNSFLTYKATSTKLIAPTLDDYLPIVGGLTYRIISNMTNYSVLVKAYDKNMNVLSGANTTYAKSQTISTPDTAKYLGLFFERKPESSGVVANLSDFKAKYNIHIQISASSTLNSTADAYILKGTNLPAITGTGILSDNGVGVRLVTESGSYVAKLNSDDYTNLSAIISSSSSDATATSQKYYAFEDTYRVIVNAISHNADFTADQVQRVVSNITETTRSSSNINTPDENTYPKYRYFSSANTSTSTPAIANAHKFGFKFETGALNADNNLYGWQFVQFEILDGESLATQYSQFFTSPDSDFTDNQFIKTGANENKLFTIRITLKEKVFTHTFGHGCGDTLCTDCYTGLLNLSTTLAYDSATTSISGTTGAKSATLNYLSVSNANSYASYINGTRGTLTTKSATKITTNTPSSDYNGGSMFAGLDDTAYTTLDCGFFTKLYIKADTDNYDELSANNWIIVEKLNATETNSTGISTISQFSYQNITTGAVTTGSDNFDKPYSEWVEFNIKANVSYIDSNYSVNFRHRFAKLFTISLSSFVNRHDGYSASTETLTISRITLEALKLKGYETYEIRKGSTLVGKIYANIAGKYSYGTYEYEIQAIAGNEHTITFVTDSIYYAISEARMAGATLRSGSETVGPFSNGTYDNCMISGTPWITTNNNQVRPNVGSQAEFVISANDLSNVTTSPNFNLSVNFDYYHLVYLDRVNITSPGSNQDGRRTAGSINISSGNNNQASAGFSDSENYLNFVAIFVKEGGTINLVAFDQTATANANAPYGMDKFYAFGQLKGNNRYSSASYNSENGLVHSHYNTNGDWYLRSKYSTYYSLFTPQAAYDNAYYDTPQVNYATAETVFEIETKITSSNNDDVYYTAFFSTAKPVVLNLAKLDGTESSLLTVSTLDQSGLVKSTSEVTFTLGTNGCYGKVSLYSDAECTKVIPIRTDGYLYVGCGSAENSNFIDSPTIYLKYDGSASTITEYSLEGIYPHKTHNIGTCTFGNKLVTTASNKVYTTTTGILFDYNFAQNLDSNNQNHIAAKIKLNQLYAVEIVYRLRTSAQNLYTSINDFNSQVFLSLYNADVANPTFVQLNKTKQSENGKFSYSYYTTQFVSGTRVTLNAYVPFGGVKYGESQSIASAPFRIVRMARWMNETESTISGVTLNTFQNVTYTFNVNSDTAGIYYVDLVQMLKLSSKATEKNYISQAGYDNDASHTGGWLTLSNADSSKSIYNGITGRQNHSGTAQADLTGNYVDMYDTVKMQLRLENGFEPYSTITSTECFNGFTANETVSALGYNQTTDESGNTYWHADYKFVILENHTTDLTYCIQAKVIEKKTPYSFYYGICKENGELYTPSEFPLTGLTEGQDLMTLVTTDNRSNKYTNKNYTEIADADRFIGYFGSVSFVTSVKVSSPYKFKTHKVDGENTYYPLAGNTNIVNTIYGYSHNGLNNGYDADKLVSGTGCNSGNIALTNKSIEHPAINTDSNYGTVGVQKNKDIKVSAYFTYTISITINVQSADNQAFELNGETFQARFATKAGYTLNSSGFTYSKTMIVGYGTTVSETFDTVIEPKFNTANDVNSYKRGYVFENLIRKSGNSPITTSKSGDVLTFEFSNIRVAETVTLLYNPILLITLNKPTSGKGTATTVFTSNQLNTNNIPYYNEAGYSSWVNSSTGTVNNTEFSRLYNAFTTIPTDTIGRGSNISATYELYDFGTDNQSTGPTYVLGVYGTDSATGLKFTTTLTPYIYSINSPDYSLESSERYIPHEVTFTSGSKAELVKTHFTVNGVNYENYSKGVYDGSLINKDSRESYYKNNTLVSTDISNATEFQTKIAVTQDATITPSFVREYTIEFRTYLSNASTDYPATIKLVVDDIEYALDTSSIDANNGDYYYRNVHVLAGETTSIKINWDDDQYDNLYNNITTFTNSNEDATSNSLGYIKGSTTNLSNYTVAEGNIVTFAKTISTAKDLWRETLYFMEKRNVKLTVSPGYLDASTQPTIEIRQNTIDPVGVNTSDNFKGVVNTTYQGNKIYVTNATTKSNNITATVQSTSSENKTVELYAEDIRSRSAYQFKGFKLVGATDYLPGSTSLTAQNGLFEYTMTIPSDHNGTTYEIIADYELNTTNKDIVKILGNGSFQIGYSKAQTAEAAANSYTLSDTIYSNDTNEITRDTAGLLAQSANYIVIKATSGYNTTFTSASAKYTNADSMYFSKKGVNSASAEDDLYFKSSNNDNIFVFSIKNWEETNLNYMQYNTEITLVFTTETWRQHTEAITPSTVTRNGVSKTGYHVTKAEQLAYIANNPSIAQSADTVIYIDSDIDLNSYVWIPFENFQGKIISEKYSISGIKTAGQKNIMLNSSIPLTASTNTPSFKNIYTDGSEKDPYTYASDLTGETFNFNRDLSMSFIGTSNGATIEGVKFDGLYYNYFNSANQYHGGIIGIANNTTLLDIDLGYISYNVESSTSRSVNYYFARAIGQTTGYNVIKNALINGDIYVNGASNIYASYLIGHSNCTDLGKPIVTSSGSATSQYLSNINFDDGGLSSVMTGYSAALISSNTSASVYIEDIYMYISGSNTSSNSHPISNEIGNGEFIYKNVYVNEFFSSSNNRSVMESTAGISSFGNRWVNPNSNNRTLRLASTPPYISGSVSVADHTGGTEEIPVIVAISSKEELVASLNKIDASNQYVELRLTSNINFGGDVWKTVNLPSGYTFNGAGYTISNITLHEYDSSFNSSGANRSNSLFGENSGVVKNLNLANVYMLVGATATYRPSSYGVIASINNGDIYSCSVNGTIDININDSDLNEVYVGGLIGTNNRDVYELEFVGDINVGAFGKNTQSPKFVGGIVGLQNGTSLNKVHSSATINTYGNTNYINNSSYFGGIIGKHTTTVVNDAYFGGNNAGINYSAGINEFEKSTSSSSKAYALSGSGANLTVNNFYSSATFRITSTNGLSSGTVTKTNAYMLSGTCNLPLANAEVISSDNLKETGSKPSGFDFENVWYYQTINNADTDYPYPMLIGNKNSHNVKVQIVVEGIDFVTSEDVANTFTLTNNQGFDQIIYGTKNESKHTSNSMDYYIKTLHDFTTNTSNKYQITIAPLTNFHIVEISVDGKSRRYQYNYRTNDNATTSKDIDVLSYISTTNGFAVSDITYARTNEHVIRVILSKNFNYFGTGINGVSGESGRSNAMGTVTATGTIVDVNGTNKTNILSGNSQRYNNNSDTQDTWYLTKSTKEYYYTNTNASTPNSKISFTFEATPYVGSANSYVATRLLGWVFRPNSDTSSTFESLKSTSYIKYNSTNSGIDLIGDILNSNSSLIESTSITTSTITMNNGIISTPFITKATLTVVSDKAIEGYYYPVVEYIYTSAVATGLHYHEHISSCYDSNGNLICNYDTNHPFDYDSTTCVSGGNVCEYGYIEIGTSTYPVVNGAVTYNNTSYPANLTARTVTINGTTYPIKYNAVLTYTDDNGTYDITPGNIVSAGSHMTIEIQGEKSGTLIGKFARRFYNTATGTLQTYYYEIENQAISGIYYIENGQKHYFNDDTVQLSRGIFGVNNSSLFVQNNTYVTNIIFDLNYDSTSPSDPLSTVGEYAFYMIDKLYDFTYNIHNAENMEETHLSIRRDTISGQIISIKNDNGTLKYAFGTSNTYSDITANAVTQSVIAMGRALNVSIMLSGDNVIISSQMPDGHTAQIVSTTKENYRLTDENDSIIANRTNKDTQKDSNGNDIPSPKYTSYLDESSTESESLGEREKGYLSYKLSLNSTTYRMTKTYTYDYGKITVIDEKVSIDIEYKKDYYSYFDQLGIDTNIPNYYSGKLSGNTTDSTKFNNTTPTITSGQTLDAIKAMFQFENTSGTDGLTKNTAFVIDNPYKLGWLAHLLNNDTNASYQVGSATHYFKDAYYRISNNLDMSHKFWLPISQFDGVIFSGNEVTNTGSINGITIELMSKNLTGSFSEQTNSISNYVGFIANSSNARLIGLNFDAMDISTDLAYAVGAVVGNAKNIYIDNLHITNSTLYSIKTTHMGDKVALGGVIGVADYMFVINQTEVINVNFVANHNGVSAMIGLSDYFGEIYNSYAFVNRQSQYKTNTNVTISNPTLRFANAKDAILKSNVHHVNSGVADSDMMFNIGDISKYGKTNFLVASKVVNDATSKTVSQLNVDELGLDSRIWQNNSTNTSILGYLKQVSAIVDMSTSSSTLAGTGTKLDPYKISSASDFVLFMNNMNNNRNNESTVYYKLTADIDLKGLYLNPIVSFKANLDGDNYKISNLYLYASMGFVVSGTTYYDLALILENHGTIDSLFVDNFHIVNSNLSVVDSSDYSTSALVANNLGTISNVSVVADIISTSKFTAGAVGTNSALLQTVISDGIIVGTDYVSAVVAKVNSSANTNNLGSSADILGYKRAYGVIACADTTNTLANMYFVGNIMMSDDSSGNQSIAGVIGINSTTKTTISNIYNAGTISVKVTNTASFSVANLANNVSSGEVQLSHAVWLSSSVKSMGLSNYSTTDVVVSGGASTLNDVLSRSSSEIVKVANFPTSTWDYTNVWSIYSDVNNGLPVFKQFNDYIVRLPYGDDYTLLNSNDLTDRYFTYDKESNENKDKLVLISPNYVVDIDNSVTSIRQNGATTISNNFVTITNVVINSNGTIYIYRGAQVNLRVTSIIYRHVTSITLGHKSSAIENVTNTYTRISDVQDISGKKLGVQMELNPSSNVSNIYDRNRFDYYIEIREDIDTYDISVSTINTSNDSNELVDAIKISENTNNATVSSTNPTLTNIPHGSVVNIELSLASAVIAQEFANIRVDYWMLKADKTLDDGNGLNYLDNNKTIVNSVETNTNKFALNNKYNEAKYTMFGETGVQNEFAYTIADGKLSIQFVATAETSGEYVVSLIKQWLVQVKFNVNPDIGSDYPIAYINGYEQITDTQKAVLELGDTQTKSAYQINQNNLGDKDNNGTVSTQSYNTQYYVYENGALKLAELDAGVYSLAGTNLAYNSGSNLTNTDYIGTTFTTKMFVDHNAYVNFNTYTKETYTFTGFTGFDDQTKNEDIVSNQIIVGSETLELITHREIITHAYYSDSMIVANYIPSKHYVNTIVDSGADLEYNTTNGVVSAPDIISSTVSTNILQGTDITSEVRHGRSITITITPTAKYILDKCCVKYYVYKDTDTARIYYNPTTHSWTSNKAEITTNYLPVVQKYSGGVLINNATTLNYVRTDEQVLSNGNPTGDMTYSYKIDIGNVVGNIELHVNFVRHYWNDAPSSTTLQGGGTKTNPYRISKASDWGYIVNNSSSNNNYFAGTYFVVTNDIDFESRFTPSLDRFAGVIFGNGYAFNNVLLDSHLSLGITSRHANEVSNADYIYGMSNVDTTTNTTKFGLINTLETQGIITGLKFNGLNIVASESNQAGINKSIVALVAENNGRLNNIVVNNSDDNISKYLIENNNNLIASANKYTYVFGGIAGINNGIISNAQNNATLNYTLDNCSNNQSIVAFGGIAGENHGQIINSKNLGNLSYIKNGLNFVSGKDKLIQGISYNIDTTNKDVLVYNVVSLGTIENTTTTNAICNDIGNILNAYSSNDYPEFKFEKTSGFATLGVNDYSSTNPLVDNGLWIEKSGIESITLDSLKMTIGTDDYYILDSADDIAWLSRASIYNNSSIQGKTFVIASSTPIDLSGRYFTPINSVHSNSFNIIGIGKDANNIVASDLLEDADVDNVVIKGMTIDSNVNIAIGSDEISIKSSFVNQISNSIIRGLDFVDVDILTLTSGATIVGTIGGTSSIANCNYISGNIYGYNNFDINNSNNTIVSGLAHEISDSTIVTGSSVTGYALQDDGTYRLHESYEFGGDLGGSIWALNGYVNASGMVANVNNGTKLQESYFNGIINSYNYSDGHSAYALFVEGSVLNNYVKGQVNSYNGALESIAGLVLRLSNNGQVINNYVATEFNLTNGNARVINAISSDATNYSVTKNYYLVDTTSTPKIGVGLVNTTSNASSDVTNNIIQISSSDLRSQNKFKKESTWDFDDIWIYINHINWDYPVLRSIYGGDTTDIDVIVYNPYKYGDDTNQLGNLNMDNNDILFTNASGKVESLYGDIVDSQDFESTTELKFTYSIITNEVGNFIVSNTSTGLITSTLFGELTKAGTEVDGVTITEDQTRYTEYATNDNADIIISQNIDSVNYGLVITFNERVFNVTVNATLTADAGTDGVQDSDYMTILLVHKDNSGVVDYAYSVNLHNNQSFKFENIYNGLYDVAGETAGVTTTIDAYGTYEIYIFYPMYYLNNTQNTYVTLNQNVSHNPTLNDNYKLADYTQYDIISTINTSNCNVNSLGSFTLDTITRDVEFSVTINKPYEYYLHHSSTNM